MSERWDIPRSRWVAKKTARRAVASASRLSGLMTLRERVAPGPRVRVLTYHRFGPVGRDPFRVDAGVFEAQMAYLADRGLALSLSDFERFLEGRLVPSPGSVLVTIDDGCRSAHDVALPILAKHGVPGVLYAVAGSIERGHGSPGEQPEPYMSWRELAELPEHGVDVGSHALEHRSLGAMNTAEIEEQARRSKEILEERLGRECRSFAYPFGTRSDFNRTTATILADVGYHTVLTSQHGAVTPTSDRHSLPRIKVEGGEGLRMFRWLCAGGLDLWRVVDRSLSRVQRPHDDT